MSRELPNGWAEITIGELGNWRGGGTPSKAQADYWSNGTIPWVSPKDMKRDLLDDAEDHITEAAIEGSATQLIPERSVLIVTRSGILRHSLPVAINTRDAAINQDLKALTPYEGIGAEFVAGQLRADAQGILSECAKAGTTVDSVDFDKLKSRKFRLAPAAEQHRIAEKVEALFARSTRARDELSHIPRLIERYRQAVLEAAFRGDLTVDWRAAHARSGAIEAFVAAIGEERRAAWVKAETEKLNAKGKRADTPSLNKKYPGPATADRNAGVEVPSTWDVVALDALAWASSYGTSAKCSYEAQGLPVARIPNVAKGKLDLTDLKFSMEDLGIAPGSEIAPGDLIVVRTNGSTDLVGRGAVVTETPSFATYFASYLIRFRLVGGDLLQKWVGLLWHSPLIRDQVASRAATSAGQYNVSMSELASFALPLAPPEEMKVIIRKVEAALNAVNVVDREYAKAAGLLPRVEAAVLDKAFAGELVPQDPADEPAAALLARIKAARAEAPVARQGRRPRA